MTSRDLILQVAIEMKKTPEQMERFINSLEENMLDMAESLKEVSDQDYKDMGFPIGLVIKIKKRLQSDDAQLAAGVQTQPEAASVAQTMVNTNKEENKIPDFNPLTVKDSVSSNTRQVAVEDSPQFQKMNPA